MSSNPIGICQHAPLISQRIAIKHAGPAQVSLQQEMRVYLSNISVCFFQDNIRHTSRIYNSCAGLASDNDILKTYQLPDSAVQQYSSTKLEEIN